MGIRLIKGGAGFLGSHLIDRLMDAGEEVICLDNYFTGRKSNISRWIGDPRFELIFKNNSKSFISEAIDSSAFHAMKNLYLSNLDSHSKRAFWGS